MLDRLDIYDAAAPTTGAVALIRSFSLGTLTTSAYDASGGTFTSGTFSVDGEEISYDQRCPDGFHDTFGYTATPSSLVLIQDRNGAVEVATYSLL